MTVEAREARPESETGTPDRTGRIRGWFAALLRSLTAILVTLVVLTAVGFAGDAVLHRVTRTSHSSSSYAAIYEVDVVLDGDGTVTVDGSRSGSQTVGLAETRTSTAFDHPQLIASVIGGTLLVTVQCPDVQCSDDLTLTVPAADPVSVRVGNVLLLDSSHVSLSGLSGPVAVVAWPSSVSITDSTSTVTGLVAGSLSCAAPAVCEIQQPS